MNKYVVIFRSGDIFHIIAENQKDALDLVPLASLWKEAPTVLRHWACKADYENPNGMISRKGLSYVPHSARELGRI